MEKTTAFWESVVAISPVLALAAVVEIRYIQWHRFTALWRYRLGFTAGLVLAALGVAALTALSVLQRWDSGRPIPEWQSELAYWAIYFGVGGVIALPVSQLWVVVFVDFSPTILFHLLQTRRLDRKHSRLLRQQLANG